MTNLKTTKRALFSSVIALVVCFTMLLGTTFAWFTDSVTSSGNIIQTGKLDVAMYWAEGDEDPTAVSDWNEAKGAIFNNDKWEPGYSEAKHIKIANEGTLALKYQMRILANGVVSELADVIDVYYFDDAKQLSRADFVDANKLGTLTEVLNVNTNANALSNVIKGSLEADKSKTVTIAFKMQESAGNEYQNLSIGSDFTIQLLATQYTSEEDSFGPDYDNGADFAPEETPSAMVSKIDNNVVIYQAGNVTLDTAYKFVPTETYEQAQESEYRWWHADYVVSADADVAANSLMLAGYYKEWCDLLSNGQWIPLTSDSDIEAGTEIRLVQTLGALVAYDDICSLGNDDIGFQCGAVDLDGTNEGTTLTVELRLYEVECSIEGHHHNDIACETGEYITIGTFTYTFDNPNLERLDDGAIVSYGDNGEVVLYDVSAVEADTYYVPDGVTALGNYAFSGNDTITEVVVSNTVTSLGRAFDTNSTIKKVVLNEGLETIDSRAFRSTTALEEVVISSTVTEIADNAFQKSGIKTITIPATVETIGETAFGASLVETVIIEGNTSIQGYAFRGCTNLRTVYLNGDDNTFIASTLNGRNSMWFCNGESNNPNTSNITFYVQNATVAARVYAAMGAEAGNTKVIVADENGNTVSETVYAQNADALNTAITNGASTVVLGSGDYIIPAAAQGKTLTIVGSGEDTSVAVTKVGTGGENCDYGLDGSNVVFENVTITTNSSTYIGYARCNGTYNNCTINGTYTLYGDSVFNNCTFNVSGDVYNIWTWGAPTAEFNNCTFNSDGKALLLYGQANTKLTINGCTFNDNGGLTALKAAIEIGNDYNKSYELIVNNTTVNGYEINDVGTSTGTTLWANKNSMSTDELNVVVDGVDVY